MQGRATAPDSSGGKRFAEKSARRGGGRSTASRRSAQVGEEQLLRAVSRLGRVAAMDEVLADLEGEVAADRAGCGLHRVGDTHQGGDRLVGRRALRAAGE